MKGLSENKQAARERAKKADHEYWKLREQRSSMEDEIESPIRFAGPGGSEASNKLEKRYRPRIEKIEKEMERKKSLYHKNLNKADEYDRGISQLREDANKAGYYI
jgi:hypothetical protein